MQKAYCNRLVLIIFSHTLIQLTQQLQTLNFSLSSSLIKTSHCWHPEEIVNRKSYSNIPLTSHSLFHKHTSALVNIMQTRVAKKQQKLKNHKWEHRWDSKRTSQHTNTQKHTVNKLFKASALSSSRSLKGVLQTATSHYFICRSF